jgi:hypothetical protein
MAGPHPHAHDPNPAPPSADPTLELKLPGGQVRRVTVDELARLPQHQAHGCFIVSTGHGTSGPFEFTGVTLSDLLAAYGGPEWQTADVVSGDGFGTQITAHELRRAHAAGAQPVLLALTRNGIPLTRDQGLVRLIVPDEQDDALRQVKWVATLVVT